MRKLYSLLLCGLLGLLILPALLAQEVKQMEKSNQTIQIGETAITFYDDGGADGDATASFTGRTTFEPQGADKVVQIQILEVGLGEGDKLFICDGSPYFSGYYAPYNFKVGYQKQSDVKDLPETVVSTDKDGKLSVCFATKKTPGKGFKMTVSLVDKPKMEVVSAGYSRQHGYDAIASQKGVRIGDLEVTTRYDASPLAIKALNYDLKTTQPQHIETLYLYEVPTYGSSLTLLGQATVSAQTGSITLDKPLILSAKKASTLRLLADIVKNPTDISYTTAGVLDIVASSITFTTEATQALEEKGAKSYKILPGVLLGEEAQTVTVKDPINFYDNGGIGANVFENKKSGVTTFLPGQEGQKVMIDFTKIDLFSGSGSTRAEKIYVYNGKEVKAENLLIVLNTEKKYTIKSTDVTGALTVQLESTTSVSRSGFEAVVKLFTPQAMEFRGLTAEAVKNPEKVIAGQSKVQVYSFTVKTEHTTPNLHLTQATFSCAGTHATINKAYLYYGGATSDVTSARLVAEGGVDKDVFSLTPQEGLDLIEGDNHFFLLYDIDAQALTDQKVSALLSSISVGGQEKTPESAEKTELTVENKFQLTKGTHTIPLYSSWIVESQPGFSGKHNYESGTRSVTFQATSENHVVDINFELLDFAYRSYSGGFMVSFSVHDGADAQAPVLFSIKRGTPKEALTEGLNKHFRSSGQQLTVVFDAKGESNAGKGFKGTVKQYLRKNMSVAYTKVSQASPAFTTAGAKNVPMLKTEITTDGDAQPLQMNSWTIDLKGASAYVGKLALSRYDGNDPATAQEIASVVVNKEDKEVKIDLSSIEEANKILQEYENFFLLSAEIRDDAGTTDNLDLAIKEIKVSDKAIDLSEATPDPEGTCEIKLLFDMPMEGLTHTRTISQSIRFYDNGGAEGKYIAPSEAAVTFKPANPGEVVTLYLNDMELPNGNKLTFSIINGSDYQGKEILYNEDDATKFKYGANQRYIASSAPDGSITVYFKAVKGARITSGWDITVNSTQPRDLFIEKVDVQAIEQPAEGLLQGSSTPLLRAAVTVSGEKGKLKAEELLAEFSAATVDSAKLYYTSTYDLFRDQDLVEQGAVNDAGEITFEFNKEITVPNVYYFWVAASVKSSATPGEKVTAQIKHIKAGNKEIRPSGEAVTASSVVKAGGLKGEFIIGTGGDERFANLEKAIKTLTKEGVAGPVTLILPKGEHKGGHWFGKIAGVSQRNAITLKGATGNPKDVIIEAGSAVGYNEKKGGVLNIAHTPHMTVRDLTIETRTKSMPQVVYILGASSNFVLDNCIVKAPFADGTPNTQQAPRLVVFDGDKEKGSDTSTEVGSNNTVIRNCVLDGGYVGLTVGNPSWTMTPTTSGALIENNKFINQGSKGIYAVRMDNLSIIGNEILLLDNAPKYEYNAIDLAVENKGVVRNNRIHIRLSSTIKKRSKAIFLRDSNDPDGTLIANNSIVIENGGNDTRVFDCSNWMTRSNVRILHNTVLNASDGCTLFIEGYDSSVMANNIIVHKGKGAILQFPGKATSLDGFTFKNNALQLGEGATIAIDAATNQYKAEEWATAVSSTNDLFTDVSFASSEVLYPKDHTKLPKGTFFEEVATDILNAPRSKTEPTVGAYEYDANVTDQAPELLSSSVDGQPGHKSAAVNLEYNQMTTVHLLAVEAGAEAPTAEKIKTDGIVRTVLGKKSTSIELGGLIPETSYDVYAIAIGTLNAVEGSVAKLLSLSTTYSPIEEGTFEDDVTTTDPQGVITSGTQTFDGFSVITDFEDPNGANKIAMTTGNAASITITNSKGAIQQIGFSLKNDRPVELYRDGEKTPFLKLPASNTWFYVDLSKAGVIKTLRLNSVGRLWIDNYNGKALSLKVSGTAKAINQGEEAIVEVHPYHGVAPYTYQWNDGSTEPTLTVSPMKSSTYEVTVTDAIGNTATTSCFVVVNEFDGTRRPATFEELTLPNGQAYQQKKAFTDGGFVFNNSYNASWNSWTGCAYSNSSATTFDPKQFATDQYNVIPGGGKDSKTFGVLYCSGDYPDYGMVAPRAQVVTKDGKGAVVDGFYITNTVWVKEYALSGVGLSPSGKKGFVDGDYFTAIVMADNDPTRTVRIDLVDYRNGKKDIVEQWQWVDLSSLGAVKELKFAIESSDSFAPAYIAIDGLGLVKGNTPEPQQKIALKAVKTTLSEIEVQWNKLPRYVSYTATINPKDAMTQQMNSTETLLEQTGTEQGNVASTTFSGLQPATTYIVTVKAFVAGSQEPIMSESIEVSTNKLSNALNLKIDQASLTMESFFVHFDRIAEATHYRVNVQNGADFTNAINETVLVNDEGQVVGTNSDYVTIHRAASPFSVEAKKLQRGTTYMVTVTALKNSMELITERILVTTTGGLSVDGVEADKAGVAVTDHELIVRQADQATVEVYNSSAVLQARYRVEGNEWSTQHQLRPGTYIVLLLTSNSATPQTFKAVIR